MVTLMNQLCKVCGEPAAGFHFGAFTCEGCKSFFGRTYSNASQMGECKNGGKCAINRKNRTSCKACRLRKCLMVGMSKSGSRYGRRSNWFKIHCLLQNQKESGSSDPDHENGDEDFSDRSLSSPNSLKSHDGATSPNPWKSSDSKSSSPTMVSHAFIDDKAEISRGKSSSVSPSMPMSSFFQPHPFMMRPGMHPMMPMSPDTLMDLQQMRPEFWRWYLSCQPPLAGLGTNSTTQLPKMPFIKDFKSVKTSPTPPAPVFSKKRSVSVMEDCEEQPLDLSKSSHQRTRHSSNGSRNLSDGISPLSPDVSDEEFEEEEESVETHFRRAGMILDLSRK